MNIKIDPVEYDNIAKLYKDGKTQKEISIIYGAKKILNYLYTDAELYLDRKYGIYQSKYV